MAQIPQGFRRFSVNLLVSFVSNEFGEWSYPGLLWRNGLKRMPPVRQHSAIGGAALLTPAGKQYVLSIGGQLEDPASDDMRVFIPVDMVQEAADRFRRDTELLVQTMEHELLGELFGDELGMGPILSDASLMEEIEVHFIGWAAMAGSPILNPAPPGLERDGDKETERLLRGFALRVSERVWQAMHNHPAIHWFRLEDVERTMDGLRVATADDGTLIGNNLLLPRVFRQ